jgi:MinD-like ATPase involved in chromosome partitioning or flagellar assembly
MLDEAPGFAAACRLAGSDSLTVSELERIGQRYRSSAGDFWVLTGIGRPSRWPELSAERVATTIDVCRTWVDFVVLDTASSLENDEEISSDVRAPRRNAATVTAVHNADRIVAVGSADPVGLSRFLRAHVDLIEAASTADVTVVMNRVRASAVGMNPNGQILQTLSRFGGIDNPVLVPNDASALDGCVLSGRTLIDSAPRSATRAAIRDLVVNGLIPDARARAPRRGLLSALRGSAN